MRQYHYFVSYQYNIEDGNGFGDITLRLGEQVTCPEQVDELRAYIKERFNYQGVVILNMILLSSEDV